MPRCVEIAVPSLDGVLPRVVRLGALAAGGSRVCGVRTTATALQERHAEFETGRVLAGQLLASIGHGGWTIAVGPRRVPIWPRGVVGSIAHSGGMCVAAVAQADSIHALGIDLEPHEPLEPELWPSVFGPSEAAETGVDAGLHARLAFSAKESVFKAQFPITGCELEFGQVSIRWDGRGGFRASFSDVPECVRGLASSLRGSSKVTNGWIVTAAWIWGLKSGGAE